MNQGSEYIEQDLLADFQLGKEAAFAAIFLRFRKRLLLEAIDILGDHTDAEDAVQEVFTRIWLKRNNLVITKNLDAYLIHAIQNHCFDQLRSNEVVYKRQKQYSLIKESITLPVLHMERKELEFTLHEAIKTLPPRTRASFVLHYEERMPQKDIATVLGIKVITVKQQVSKGLKLLRQKLSKI